MRENIALFSDVIYTFYSIRIFFTLFYFLNRHLSSSVLLYRMRYKSLIIFKKVWKAKTILKPFISLAIEIEISHLISFLSQ